MTDGVGGLVQRPLPVLLLLLLPLADEAAVDAPPEHRPRPPEHLVGHVQQPAPRTEPRRDPDVVHDDRQHRLGVRVGVGDGHEATGGTLGGRRRRRRLEAAGRRGPRKQQRGDPPGRDEEGRGREGRDEGGGELGLGSHREII